MVVADLEHGTFLENDAVSRDVAGRRPYADWVAGSVTRLDALGKASYRTEAAMDASTLLRLQVRVGSGHAHVAGRGRRVRLAGRQRDAARRAGQGVVQDRGGHECVHAAAPAGAPGVRLPVA
jgi:hypothetical protein